jgi:ion channel POLLUX/CASTOR
VARSGLRERLRYRFDNTMSKGAPALIGLLGILSAVLVVVFGVAGYLARPPEGKDWSIGKTLYMALLRAMDPGTVTGDEGPPFWIFLMFGVTIGGIFIVAALVGVITTGLEAKLDDLRKGRSQVVEEGHTVLLGWSEQLFTVVSELAVAKESERRPCVAILADRDKVEMEDEIRSPGSAPSASCGSCAARAARPNRPTWIWSVHSPRRPSWCSPRRRTTRTPA